MFLVEGPSVQIRSEKVQDALFLSVAHCGASSIRSSVRV